ncbi:MAG: hypothetical protein M1538_02655 [Candidatus Marsarchaeota archaeon]|jgi:3-hydroxy-3-methylglutaryl CoA synthase|nr:hypothetical protein [Candidatus Marsarchaeota archaeon]
MEINKNETYNKKNEEDKKFGVNFFSITTPATFISAEELGKALNEDSNKISKGLGFSEIHLPTFSTSNVTMTADVLYDFIKSIAEDKKQSEKFFDEPIKEIYFATESNDDLSRPEVSVALSIVYSKLLSEDEHKYRPYIETFKRSEVKQVTFACAGGGLSLTDAVSRSALAYKLGRKESAIVITSDTAVYDAKRAPKAETTQGAATALLWITSDPALESIDYVTGFSAFNLPFSDFTKFGDRTPKVYGVFSERGYVYGAAEVVMDIERKFKKNNKKLTDLDFLIAHVPFPKQAIYFATFLFEHHIKTNQKEFFEELQKRIGSDPLSYNHFVDIMDKKFKSFDQSKHGSIVDYISNDEEITAFWKWLAKIREINKSNGEFKIKEFENFLRRYNIPDALELPSHVGNSYTSSVIISNASLLNSFIKKGVKEAKKGIIISYGSGKVIVGIPIEINIKNSNNLHINNIENNTIPLKASQYELIHDNLIKGDAARTIVDINLLEIDKKLLEKLPDGFHLLRRYEDGTADAVYVKNNKIEEIKPRY